MKCNNIKLFVYSAFVSVCFFACDSENSFLRPWREDEEPQEIDYVAIIKDVPILVYQTVEYYPEYIYTPGETVYVPQKKDGTWQAGFL